MRNNNFQKFKFSIILVIQQDADKLMHSVESILNQSLDFEEYNQLILINTCCDDKSNELCCNYQKQFPNNILVLSKKGLGLKEARNLGLKYADGNFVNFLNSGGYFSKNALEEVDYFFKENLNKIDIVEIPFVNSDKVNFIGSSIYNDTRIIDLDKDPNNSLTLINAIFIRKVAISDLFNETLMCSDDFEFIYNILLKKKKYAVLNNAAYFYKKSESNILEVNSPCKEKLYFQRLTKIYLKILNKCLSEFNHIPSFIQYAISYDIQDIFLNANISELDQEDKEEFIYYIKHIMGFLGEGATIYNKNIQHPLNLFFYYLHESNLYTEVNDDSLSLKISSKTIDILKKHKLWINKVEIKNNYLIIPCVFTSFFNKKNILFEAIEEFENGNVKIHYAMENTNTVSEDVEYLSKVFKFKYDFYFKIPISIEESKIKFLLKYSDENGVYFEQFCNVSFLNSSNLSINYNSIVDNLSIFEFTDDSIIKTNLFAFTIIMAVYNVEKYLNESIESIINQTLDFEKNIQLILVDDGSLDNSKEIALKYQEKFPKNILVLSKENGGQASARNLGLKYAKGKYINFLDSDDYISLNTLENVYNFFECHYSEIDVVAIPMILFERVSGPHRLNYKFGENQILDLVKNPNNPLLSGSSSFIKYERIKHFNFDTELVNLEDALVINKILLDKKKYGVLNTCEYYYRQRFDRNSTVDHAKFKKEFFTQRLERFYMRLINYCMDTENHVPLFIQYLMAYDLQWLLKTETLDIFDNDDELDDFWRKLTQVLKYINKETIYGNFNISGDVKPFFLYLLNEKFSTIIQEDSLIFKVGRYEIDKLDKHKIWLDIVEIKEDNLNISGIFSSYFNNKNISIKLIKNKLDGSSEEFLCKQTFYSVPERVNKTFLDIEWKYIYNFDVCIPLIKGEEFSLSFIVEYNNDGKIYSKEVLINLNHSVNLSLYSSYLQKKPYIVLLKSFKLYVKRFKFSSILRYEFHNLKKIINDKPNHYLDAVKIRLLYLLLYPFLINKNIWIFGDRPNFADDNAKHLFKYSIQKQDKIKKYFVVNKNSDSFNEMKSISKNIIPFGSLKHKIYFLFSKKNIFSYVNEDFINPFFDLDVNLYKGIVNTEYIFLQHGVTKDNISKFVKKYNHNLSLIVSVSDLERNSFLEKGYNYDESIIKVLGFPRFDNLKNTSDKKQILFMPTWRMQLDDKNKFLESEYYKQLQFLLSNSKLVSLLNKYDYDFVFKPHAELVKYLDLISIDENVIISEHDSYQDLFNSSSLLITDFSSVFFDFAYLKKPVIYYQPNDDYHYEKGYFNYETMGFGKVIKDNVILLETIENYLKNNCTMENVYKENVESFFKFIDKNNCKRVYDWLIYK